VNIHNPAILILVFVIFELEYGGKRARVQPEDTVALHAEIFDEFFGDGGDEVDERRGRGLL
jgi:hypothetical protein